MNSNSKILLSQSVVKPKKLTKLFSDDFVFYFSSACGVRYCKKEGFLISGKLIDPERLHFDGIQGFPYPIYPGFF